MFTPSEHLHLISPHSFRVSRKNVHLGFHDLCRPIICLVLGRGFCQYDDHFDEMTEIDGVGNNITGSWFIDLRVD